MFRINNKSTRATLIRSNIFRTLFRVLIADIEQVNVSWVYS